MKSYKRHMKKTKQPKSFWRSSWVFWPTLSLLVVACLATVSLWAVFLFQYQYQDKMYPNVHVGPWNVSGMTKEQANLFVQKNVQAILDEGITLSFQNRSIQVPSAPTDLINPELSSELYFYHVEDMIDEAYSYGRSSDTTLQGRINDVVAQWNALLSPVVISANVHVSKELLTQELYNRLIEFETPVQNAKAEITFHENGTFQLSVIPEKRGTSFSYHEIVADIISQLHELKAPKRYVFLQEQMPDLTRHQIQSAFPSIKEILNEEPSLTLAYDEQEWALSPQDVASFITVASDAYAHPVLTADKELFEAYIKEHIAPEIEEEPKNATFTMQENVVTEFIPGTDGVKVDLEMTIASITDAFKLKQTHVPLAVVVDPADVKTADTNELGIKELIGVGYSYFSGSPANRRHNIDIGAESLHGLIIKPDEEFSLIQALGDIDGEAGYKTELVIKGDRTVPEYGGGLCQIGTTLFRGVLNTGLPVTQRRNHSYRVRYYEPAGTDATIYDPAPDFRFLNDTGHHILLQTFIEGDVARFELWGTKDGRKVTQTDPIVYNIVPAGPTKYVLSEELEPGQEKCVESPHNGATAEFDYSVEYPDGELKEKTFTSYYRPWPKVCLVGEGHEALQEEEVASDETKPTVEVIQEN